MVEYRRLYSMEIVLRERETMTHRSVGALLSGVFTGSALQVDVHCVDDVEEVLDYGDLLVDSSR